MDNNKFDKLDNSEAWFGVKAKCDRRIEFFFQEEKNL